MRLLVFARPTVTNRVCAALCDGDIEPAVMSRTDLGLIANDGRTLALVDAASEGARLTSRHLKRKLNIPVLVMVNARVDWSSVSKVDADGYIQETAGNLEFKARLLALAQRRMPVDMPGG